MFSCTHTAYTPYAQYLSRKGADLEAEDPQARLPLHHAAASVKGQGAVEALRYLIQHTTWISAPDAHDDTPLHLAARCVEEWIGSRTLGWGVCKQLCQLHLQVKPRMLAASTSIQMMQQPKHPSMQPARSRHDTTRSPLPNGLLPTLLFYVWP